MPRFLKPSKVVVILNGRYAGKKAVIHLLSSRDHPLTIYNTREQPFDRLTAFEWLIRRYHAGTDGHKLQTEAAAKLSSTSFNEHDEPRHQYSTKRTKRQILNTVLSSHWKGFGSKERGYGHAIVAGVERYPLKITKNMGKKRVAKRSKVKPFIKIVNYNHMMPTRYGLELESLKSAVTLDSFKEPSQREEAKKAIKKLFEERYNSGKNKWFFTKLRF
ncbi:hypothetical protein BG015_009069 [Linnemannia schmuckeri]|uniref:60S ribosomal protein L27 n=1 Tax=Linnemannia schmuckeri TaxID=64567 RepID=A0A9P5RZJ8_9FUNG|nr:hypothetical protein BG015_009069 [Linnemannia schmuckeri]